MSCDGDWAVDASELHRLPPLCSRRIRPGQHGRAVRHTVCNEHVPQSRVTNTWHSVQRTLGK
eukprot:11512365-Alexandrium_andersonii.AAC.1